MANEAEPVFAHFTTLSAWLFVFRLFVTHVLSIAAAQAGQCYDTTGATPEGSVLNSPPRRNVQSMCARS